MRKVFTFGLLVLSIGMANAQDFDVKPSKASQAYREYRLQMTAPTFGYKKVMALIKKLKPDSEDNRRMADKTYKELSFEEKFTYAMMHGEENAQNCDAMPPYKDEEKKIFGYIPGNFGDEATWSPRQLDFLTKNRARVISLIRKTIVTRQRVGVNLKTAIIMLSAKELIPDMISVYNKKKYDQDILTVLMFLMKEGNYEPFIKSQSHEKLYGENSNYRGYIEANSANQKLVIERAMGFYKAK